MRRYLVGMVVLGLLSALPATSQSSDFVDTRITFIFSDDDVLAGPGETLINSPDADFGPREGNFFPFENLDTQYTGQETLTHVVLYGMYPGFSDYLLTEAALVLRAEFYGRGNIAFGDDGSYLKLTWSFNEPISREGADGETIVEVPDRNMELTLFPFTSERFRLGYLYDLTWGGGDQYVAIGDVPVPAFRLQYNDRWGYAYAGMKTTRLLQALRDPNQPGHNEMQAYYGFLGGVGFNLAQWCLLEFNGGFFQSGTNRKPDVIGEPINTYGASGRLSFYDGLSPGTSIDLRLYQNTPEFADYFLLSEPGYRGSVAWLISVEVDGVAQTLGDPDVTGGTITQPGFASAISFDTAFGFWEVQADLIYESLAYMLRDVPSLDPMNAFPEDSEQIPNLMAVLGAQYFVEAAHLTPGILVGFQRPAAYRGLLPELPSPPGESDGVQTVVVRDERNFEPLPQGEDVGNVYSAKVWLRWDLSRLITVVGQLLYSYDPNQTTLVDSEFGYAVRTFRDPHIFGFAIFSQARF